METEKTDEVNLLNQMLTNSKICFRGAGEKLCDDSWKCCEIYIDYDSIGYVEQGQVYLKINDTEKIIKQGELYYIPANTYYSHHVASGSAATTFWCHFELRVSNQSLIELMEFPIGIKADSPEYLCSIFNGLIDCITNKQFGSTLKAVGLMNELVAEYLRLCKDFVRIKSNEKFDVMNKAFQYIVNNLDKNLTVKKLAAYVSLSQNYFIEVFKNYFNETPIQFILFKKEEVAQELLIYSDKSIKEIAASLGFVSQNHFSQFFKKRSGYSPINYRMLKRGRHTEMEE